MFDVDDAPRTPLPWTCAVLAAHAYLTYRRRGAIRLVPQPDFYIGTHAAVANLSVLSRDVKPYRNYLRRLCCIGPDEIAQQPSDGSK